MFDKTQEIARGKHDYSAALARTVVGAQAARSQTIQADRSGLEVMVQRIESQAMHAQEVENALYALMARLQGESPAEGCVENRPPQPGIIGKADHAINDIERALISCTGILSTLRGLV